MHDLFWSFIAIAAAGVLTGAGSALAQTQGGDARCDVEEAAVVLSCRAQSSGRLRDCTVVGVTPPNCGFEEAALAAAQTAEVGRSSRQGASRAGGRVQFAVRFRAPFDGVRLQPEGQRGPRPGSQPRP